MFIGKIDQTKEWPIHYSNKTNEEFICDSNLSILKQKDYSIAFIGRLYNKKELRLIQLTNIEAVNSLYKEKGLSAFSQLDGSFVIILKTINEKIHIIRDHHGTGSQIYYNKYFFASSLHLLQQMPGFSNRINYQTISQFLSIGYIATPHTAFEDTFKLGAGEMLTIHNGEMHIKTLYPTDSILAQAEGLNLDTYSEKYGYLHEEAIRRRIENSKNVGILLSGGYDSGSNLVGLRKIYKGDIHSYSIGFKGDNWTELPLAKCMSEKFGTIHTEYEINGSEILSLPEIVKYLGDPFVEGGLMVNYAAMKIIGDNKPDIILGGDGSDQYFGTSGRELALHYLIKKNGLYPFMQKLYSMLNQNCFDKDNKIYRLRFQLEKILKILAGDSFGFPQFILSNMLKDKSYLSLPSEIRPNTKDFAALYIQHAYKTDIEKVINQVILFKASKMAEMFGNQLSYPYMDLSIYQFLQELPIQYKCKGENVKEIAKGNVISKFLLKYHYKPMLPEIITSKKKQGGFAPMPIFFKDPIQRKHIADFILSSSLVKEYLNQDAVESFIRCYDIEADKTAAWFWYKQNRAIQYFYLLNLAIWWEYYVKKNDNISL